MIEQPPRTRRRRWIVGAFVVVGLVLGAGAAFAADDVAKLAERLAELRAEVEELSGQVEAEKAELDARLRSTQSQKADLEVQVQREQMRLEKLAQSVDEHKARMQTQQALESGLAPAVTASVDEVRSRVAAGLPFKRAERLAELDKIDRQMAEGLITPQKAASRLWTFVEDELRLARENGLYRQVVTVEGDETLADVARVGMVAIYYKTDDGRVGMAVEQGDEWRWQPLRAEGDVEQVRSLFDQFAKNIRVGYFELPNPAASTGPATSNGGAK